MDIAYSIDDVPIRLTTERWFHMANIKTEPILGALPYLTRFPTQRFWVDYDEEADVLYISFKRPQKATNSEMTDEGILYRYRDKELVGLTILDVSSRIVAWYEQADASIAMPLLLCVTPAPESHL